jgi:hypothetical protein
MTCSCGQQFESKDNRKYDFSKLPKERQEWPFPAFINLLKEFSNFQTVKCPICGKEQTDKKIKMLFFFSPLQLFITAIIIDILILLIAIADIKDSLVR